MERAVHSELVQVRVNPALLTTAKRQAQRSGMTLSEFLRAAVRDKLREAA